MHDDFTYEKVEKGLQVMHTSGKFTRLEMCFDYSVHELIRDKNITWFDYYEQIITAMF